MFTNETLMAHLLAFCEECERVFDLAKPSDLQEWHYGHDCEA